MVELHLNLIDKEYIMIIALIITIILFLIILDRYLNKIQLKKIENDSQYEIELEQLKNKLIIRRIIYIIVYIVLFIYASWSTDMKFDFSTVPDYESIKQYKHDGRIIFSQDAEEIFVKKAEIDTNGLKWGGFFIIIGFFGLYAKASFITAKLPINSLGNIQYLVNIILILLGVYMIIRAPLYENMDWKYNVEFNYNDFLEEFHLEEPR